MKTTITRLLKILALIIPVIMFVSFMQSFLFCNMDQTTERVRRFYEEEENSLDVIFLGAGDVSTGFAPGLAYEEFGFTSYLYTFDANPASLYKYQLREILSTQQPQAILVELNGFLYDDGYQKVDVKLCNFIDHIPFSLNKLEALQNFDTGNKLLHLVPFVKYHGEWAKGHQLLETYRWKTSIAKGPSKWKGITNCTRIEPFDPAVLEGPNPSQPEKNIIANRNLVDFLEYCKKENLSNVIFVRFPHRNAASFSDAVTYAEQVLVQYGYPLWNMEEEIADIGLDFNRDFFNDEHTNIYGMEKLTLYIGDYLTNEILDTPVPQSEANKKHWEECAAAYQVYHDYNYAMIERGYEAWPGEEPYEVSLIERWIDES